MKLYQNLEATEDNIRDTYESDLLSRKDSVIQFAEFLKSPYCPTSIAVNGEWGSGKTFFVKQTAYHLSTLEDASDKCLTVYYDAWENDNECDPIISIVDCIARVAGEEDENYISRLALDFLKTAVDTPLLRGVKTIIDRYEEKDAESDFGYSKTKPTNAQIKNKLKALFDEIINEHGERLILFVDELDRCNPDFAVKVLERLKHYFTIDNRVKIVFSVNINQLEHTIKHFYGDDFDSHRYLDRFFDIVLPIPEAETTLYIARYMKRNVMSDDFSSGVGVCSIIKYFEIQIRDIKIFMSELDSGYDTVKKESLLNSQLNKYQNFMNYIYPIILAAKFKDKEKYKLLIQGKGEDIIKNFYKYDQKTPDAINMIIDIYIRFFDAEWDNQYSTKIIKYIEKPFGI
nr:MAG TPA: KAP family P-loop domain [Caudoviricetes sp.]